MTTNGSSNFDRAVEAKDKTFRWVHAGCFLIAAILLFIPNEAISTGGSILGGIAMLAYAAWIAFGMPYIWTMWMYAAPVVAFLLLAA